ncbi:MAG TPA: thio(seleno)oxazole modification radical SAM maturase SbtM [Armatimonadota bacterium]|jgi:selenobiotic family peptide radical SAM maturase
MLSEGMRGRRTNTFTLQWHLTNACELACKHCYDRSSLQDLELDDCRLILREFQSFCHVHRVQGQVSVTGGNPMLHPGFWELYREIRQASLRVSILGNPLDEEPLARLVAAGRPGYYQVSLEGLPHTNDAIRGAGHFDRTVEFLEAAVRHGLNTHVMLTVHQRNLDEVLPLGRQLSPVVRKFTFNRLAQVGEGHSLPLPEKSAYTRFLREYLEAAAENPHLAVKENLCNLLRCEDRRPVLQGCTGFGCGAAFNFVAVLPDGEVHACRKFPSPLGRLPDQSLTDIYRSPAARAYRRGPITCARCSINRHCRGCMAVIAGHGVDPLAGPDPMCFRDEMTQARSSIR